MGMWMKRAFPGALAALFAAAGPLCALENRPSSFVEQGANYQLARVYQKLHREAGAQHALARLKELKAESAKTIPRADQISVNP